ncbi:MAG: hypothetical protein HYV36_04750, partial [Lentisphaerae bacterium]|nr:hypothetical protein [Lentisphaerota bacterium]
NKGHKLGFVGGTDNHCGWPVILSELATAKRFPEDEVPLPSRIYTGVWARSRCRDEVFLALSLRHTWACWDTRAIVWFSLNGVLQGGELRVKKGSALKAWIKLSVEAPLELLEIVSRAGVVRSYRSFEAGLDLEKRVNLGAALEDSYYYLRARQKDGALIYASPVFVSIG